VHILLIHGELERKGVKILFKVVNAYLYNEPGKQKVVVTDQDGLCEAEKEFFEPVVLVIPLEKIKDWHEEIELLDLDDAE